MSLLIIGAMGGTGLQAGACTGQEARATNAGFC